MEQLTVSKLENKYNKAVYHHSAYLTSLQSTSCEMPGCMTQAGIKLARRNNNFRYADDSTLMVKREEEQKSLLMRVKEETEKAGLKLKIMASCPITAWQIDGETMETVRDFIFLSSKITADGD